MKKESELTMPEDLRNAITDKQAVARLWKDITPIARRDFVTWIISVKQPETRKRRIEVTCSKLLAGKRRPCCYAVVPMNLYKALGANPKAKATWSALTSDERRDIVASLDKAKNTAMRGILIDEICTKLAIGKKNSKS